MPTGYYKHPKRHGMSKTPVYGSWENMIQRCTNPKSNNYQRWGGRGITVCDRWRDFKNFYADMGDPPDGCSIDRIDNDKGYCLENCRWATIKEQNRNLRTTRFLTLNGVTKPLTAWADELGINPKLIHTRKNRGWSDEKTLTTPVKKRSSAAAA